MPQFVIEREMPGVGKLGAEDLKGASQGSCSVLRELGPEIQWGKRENFRDGFTSDDFRIQFSFKYNFSVSMSRP